MREYDIKYVFILLLGVFFSAVSQVLLKKASQKKYTSLIKEYLNPLVIISYGIFFGVTLLSVFAYKGIPLSMGPVLETTSYVYITFFGIKIFHEKINKMKILALMFIVGGIIVYSICG